VDDGGVEVTEAVKALAESTGVFGGLAGNHHFTLARTHKELVKVSRSLHEGNHSLPLRLELADERVDVDGRGSLALAGSRGLGSGGGATVRAKDLNSPLEFFTVNPVLGRTLLLDVREDALLERSEKASFLD
jgi:hypothetical protein